LEGYMSFHHLLLAFTQKRPGLIQLANSKIKQFIEEKECRDKEVTPDLGELIVSLSISSYKWEDFIPSLMDELFQRDARWILAKYPGLRNFEGKETISCIRMTQSFHATMTGKRLSMFQRFFMKEIACPSELEGNPNKCKILFDEYNSRFGRPVPGIARRLQLHSRKVLAAASWWEYFDLVGFCAPSSVSLSNWLRNSIELSDAREYHSEYQVLKYRENHIEGPKYDLHLNPKHCCCCGGHVFDLDDMKKAVGGKMIAQSSRMLYRNKERIDIAFVVDCTGSMTSWLESAKRQIRKIITQITSKTMFKVVRFALVEYRDFGGEGGYGSDRYVTRKKEFTSRINEIQSYVDAMRVGGGGNCEALSTGLYEAASLTWNNDAMRIIVHIGDQCAHGMGSSGDSYRDGSPNGRDALAIAHNLAKKGVVIYNVDCGSSYSSNSGLRQAFYHTLSFVTGGVCVNLQNAGILAEIVLGATMEEEVQDTLEVEVSKIYADVIARHLGARQDQLVYELTQRLKAAGVKVRCMLGNDDYSKAELKQIELIAFCTELKQVKAMQDKGGEYFMGIDSSRRGKKQIVDAKKRFATERQVRACLRRIQDKLTIRTFENRGCQYRTDQWKRTAFKGRWETFKDVSPEVAKFRPWLPLTGGQLAEATANIKKAGKIGVSGMKRTYRKKRRVKVSSGGWNTVSRGNDSAPPSNSRAEAGSPAEPVSSTSPWNVRPKQSSPAKIEVQPTRREAGEQASVGPINPQPVQPAPVQRAPRQSVQQPRRVQATMAPINAQPVQTAPVRRAPQQSNQPNRVSPARERFLSLSQESARSPTNMIRMSPGRVHSPGFQPKRQSPSRPPAAVQISPSRLPRAPIRSVPARVPATVRSAPAQPSVATIRSSPVQPPVPTVRSLPMQPLMTVQNSPVQPPVNFPLPSIVASVQTIQFNPSVGPLGLTFNLHDGLITAVNPHGQGAGYSVKPGELIIALNGLKYAPELLEIFRRSGNPFNITIAVPQVQTKLNLLPVPQNVPVAGASRSQTPQAPIGSQLKRSSRGSSSSSGSPRRNSRCRSRTPDSTPVIMPDMDKAVRITSRKAVDVNAISERLRYAGVFPKDVRLLNERCALATFNSVFSANLASRTDLGQGLKVELAQGKRV